MALCSGNKGYIENGKPSDLFRVPYQEMKEKHFKNYFLSEQLCIFKMNEGNTYEKNKNFRISMRKK